MSPNKVVPIIIDQQTDSDFKLFFKIASNINDDLLVQSLETVEIEFDVFAKLASTEFADTENNMFPVNTKENTILSKLYFDIQRDQLLDKVAEDISDRLDTFMELHSVPESIFTYNTKVLEKNAATKGLFTPVYMLPEHRLCKVANCDDLLTAEVLFDMELSKLPVSDRIQFSQNFMKAAQAFNVSVTSSNIAKYACVLDTDLDSTTHFLEARAALARRTGQSGTEFLKLADLLSQSEVDGEKAIIKKLADTILSLDIQYGFDAPKFDGRIPDAYASVFNKEAEDFIPEQDQGVPKLEELSEAEIAAQYGVDSLEESKDENGDIDYDVLREIADVKETYSGE